MQFISKWVSSLVKVVVTLGFVLVFMPFSEAQNPSTSNGYFEGTVEYDFNFKDLKGNDINKKALAFFDEKHTFYFDDQNYKIINEHNKVIKLFQGKYDAYFYFNTDNSAYKIDQTSKTSQRVMVYETEDVDTILGYPCKSVKVDADFRAYIYFYNPNLKIDKTPYLDYNMEEWNTYLKATDGAVPLKVIVIDIRNKMVIEKEATSVTKQDLPLSTFDFPADHKLRKLKYGIDLIW